MTTNNMVPQQCGLRKVTWPLVLSWRISQTSVTLKVLESKTEVTVCQYTPKLLGLWYLPLSVKAYQIMVCVWTQPHLKPVKTIPKRASVGCPASHDTVTPLCYWPPFCTPQCFPISDPNTPSGPEVTERTRSFFRASWGPHRVLRTLNGRGSKLSLMMKVKDLLEGEVEIVFGHI